MDRHENSQRDPLNAAGKGDLTSQNNNDRLGESSPLPKGEEPQPSLGQWLRQNAFLLTLMLALLVYLVLKFDADGLWAIAKAVLGLNLIIFVHELGHFLVARWCDVHVQLFSIGFGPAIPGCKFKWGETTYLLGILPLGGYVQMVGQVDGEEAVDPNDTDPRSYRNKTVWQRMAIISAGVIMNALLAVVCYIIVFMGPGKERTAAVVARIASDSPAFKQGIRTGAIIHQIGTVKDPYFEDLLVATMASTHGEKLTFISSRPSDSQRTKLLIEPRLDKDDTRPIIGIAPADSTQLQSRRILGRYLDRPVVQGSAASQAKPPLEFGDRIIAMSDPQNPKKVTDLPLDPRKPGSQQRDYFEFQKRMQLLAGQEVILRVVREEGEKEKWIDIKVPPAWHVTLGARMEMGQVTSLRDNSPAALAGMQIADKTRSLHGDVILAVEVNEADGKLTRFVRHPVARPTRLGGALLLPWVSQPLALQVALNQEEHVLDPVRLPDQLRAWAQRLQKANVPEREWKVKLTVKRHKSPDDPDKRQFDEIQFVLNWDHSWAFDRVEPFYLSSPLAIPELGLAYQVQTTVAGLEPEQAQAAGLQAGDVIEKIRFHSISDKEGTVETSSWLTLEPHQWASIFWRLQSPSIQKVTVQVNRNKQIKEIEIVPRMVTGWAQESRGLILAQDMRLQKARTFHKAVAMGLYDTHNHMMQVFLSLRGMFTGRISVKNLGGPVTIARAAYQIAGVDIWEFIFFLGFISINLAVINFLPIPILDGGHMVFLIYEKIRGKPASEAVRVGATFVGLILLGSLLIFVFYLDVARLF